MPRSYWSVKKYGQPVVHGVLAEHGLRGDLRLVQRVRPVLDPDAAPQQRVEGVGDVADGEDVRVGACAAARRRGRRCPRPGRPSAARSTFGRDADADDDRVGRDDAAVAELDRPSRPTGPRGRRRRSRRTAGRRRARGAGRRTPAPPRGPSTRSSGSSALSSTVTWLPAAAGGGRGLEPDPARADDATTSPRAGTPRVSAVAVVERAQVVHARQVGAGQPAAGAATSRWRAAAGRSAPARRRGS